MAAAEFLLELRCEEIPARMQAKASEDLARLFTERLADAGLTPDRITSYVTPRRLALIAHGLPLQTEAVSEEFKGPRTSAPDQALDGFLRKTGLTKDQLQDRDGVWFAVVERPGRATADVLAEAVPAVIRAFPWPKSMRWGDASTSTESLRWVRPLQGIVAIFGDDLVPCSVDGVESGFATLGHRFHHLGVITIGNAHDYAEKLRACHVIVDAQERAQIIEERAKALAAAAGLSLIEDAGLVAENAGLTEWPVPLLGWFDPAFLDVPPEVIQLTLRTNQKYFVLRDAAGKLAPAFICTANIEAKDGGAAIVAGNGKVLAARLSDARFFWEQDKKTPLAVHAEKLGRITFHEKLGTVADKVERVAKLARWLASPDSETGKAVVPGCDPDLAEQAARLCKADLVTEMVGEFPELQGLMGGYYARAEGLPDAVADAIRDHYKPVGQGDDVPTAPVTVAVSLADKLDSFHEFFGSDMQPTGSKDPFALRRTGLGIIALMTVNGVRYPVGDAHGQWDFIVDRLKVQQREAGVRHDVIDAVVSLGGENLIVRLLARVHALQSFIATEDGANLLAGYKRAANILKKEERDPTITPAAPSEPAEAALASALESAEPRADAAIAAEDFEGAMAALATLRAPIDGFFETVTVNAPEQEKRSARLALLERVRVAVHKVADFSKIEG
ncbi:glycine--tRNA ligase subunit beta [Sphingobium subterraneum]|uniref:Glycine--tRNA ligase beta subunit n=1 Tax=Sphingobium subterraneum TaxID=627688 RepID=A0A841J2C1_9SPHN|nr:glycine--tRNA ligase subunit beta [Sphingobium subterraneum]MBB6122785.1 glycyl-tRNA synthetase beta chain [Sphingobium subterraneum]